MKGNIFLDSNVLLYAFDKDEAKKNIAKGIIRLKPVISSQVVNEVISVLLKKFTFSVVDARQVVTFLTINSSFRLIDGATIDLALVIREKYIFSYWDSLIVASALEQNCTKLYTEDMQHGQVIEKQLKIINPFLPTGQ
jgi:predicted nucleic acid-binding protein